MSIEYDNIAESDLPFGKYIPEQHWSKVRRLTARSASSLWSFYCYPGRFDFHAHSQDAIDATLVSTKSFDGLDEETAMNQVATWLSSMIDAAETEAVYFLRAEWSIDGFEVPWEVFIATWYWLLPFLPEGHAVMPSKNIVIEFAGGDCRVHRLSLSDGMVPDEPDDDA